MRGEQYRYYASRMSSTDWLLAYVQPEADLLPPTGRPVYLGWAQLFSSLAALLLVAMMQRLVLPCKPQTWPGFRQPCGTAPWPTSRWPGRVN